VSEVDFEELGRLGLTSKAVRSDAHWLEEEQQRGLDSRSRVAPELT
jgi:hypothetical protein